MKIPFLSALFVFSAALGTGAEKPNIVFVLCDDLGYGDVHCLAPNTSKIPTPNADRLASEGMIFTDAHSGSSVCTPTRYGLLTGRYSWRSKLQKGVTTGFAPCLIKEDQPTVASFLHAQGYYTGIIGKWHLDFQYLDPRTGEAYRQKDYKEPPAGARIPDGPLTRGFDYYHGFHHARNMRAVIENDAVIEHDEEINMLPRLTKKSVEFIDSHAGGEQPFFLYVPLGSPHTPIVPSDEWKGKSGLGDYGDFVMQTDHALGEIMKALKKNGIEDNTLLFFSSDNGCSKAAGIQKLAEQGHLVSAYMRGSKADIWDGGHRVPFIVRWPGQVEPGSNNNQLVCLVDLFATMAEIAGVEMPEAAAPDSVSMLPAFFGKPIESTRNGVIHHSISGHFAYRQNKWKLALARGSGGWTSPTEKEVEPGTPEAQLYDLDADPGEESNLYQDRPEIAKKLLLQLEEDVARGRSTDGPEAKNDVPDIVLWKSGQGPAPEKGKKKKIKK